MWCAAVLGEIVLPLCAQTPPSGASARRALIITNTIYKILPRAPVDGSGANDLEEVLSDAQFAVSVKHDLDGKSLTDVLDKFQLSVRPTDITFVYYSGYAAQVRGKITCFPWISIRTSRRADIDLFRI